MIFRSQLTIAIPNEPIKDVFTTEVLRSLSTRRHPSRELLHRLEVLRACGPPPSEYELWYRVKWLRAKKAAWETYLEAAFVCGMFEGKRDADLRARLTGTDDDGFRSAMAECMACWFLAGRMKLSVNGLAEGRGNKMLDMRVQLPDGEAGVEVKAPFRQRPRGTTMWYGDDTDKIGQCLETAEKQFDKEGRNVLVIAPNLRTTMSGDRGVLVRAAYGESIIVFDVNKRESRIENQRREFAPRGKFLNTVRPGGMPLKWNGFPAYQRVSAVLCIEERVSETHPFPADDFLAASMLDYGCGEMIRIAQKERELHYSDANEIWISHNVLLLHNPHAYHPLSEVPWTALPQLVRRNHHMEWTDGYNRPV